MSSKKALDNIDLMGFIKPQKPCVIYLHTTHEDSAIKMFNNGFLFQGDKLSYTTDEVSYDEVVINWCVAQRKSYGECLVILHIGKNLMKKYSFFLEEILAQDVEKYDFEMFQEGDVKSLPSQFVKGYYHKANKTFFPNPSYNPTKDSKVFKDRFLSLKKQK